MHNALPQLRTFIVTLLLGVALVAGVGLTITANTAHTAPISTPADTTDEIIGDTEPVGPVPRILFQTKKYQAERHVLFFQYGSEDHGGNTIVRRDKAVTRGGKIWIDYNAVKMYDNPDSVKNTHWVKIVGKEKCKKGQFKGPLRAKYMFTYMPEPDDDPNWLNWYYARDYFHCFTFTAHSPPTGK